MSLSRAPVPPSAAPASSRPQRTTLRAIVIVYIVLGAMYAAATPPWQVPDEPAHYNYARYVATHGSLPELRQGDYPAAYLEEIKARRFAPELAIDPIRYESHQPPLYYILAAALYRLATRSGLPELVVLRGFSVFLTALTLLVAAQLVNALYPREPVLAPGTVAFAAVLPMHVAMSAAVNNDALAGLLVATIAWRLIAMSERDWTPRRALGIGALLGLALLTKMQSYVAFAVAAIALLWDLAPFRGRPGPGAWRRLTGRAAVMFGIALLMALPWLLRNAGLYGPGDPLGLARHDQVVQGQLTTREFLTQHGWATLAVSFVQTTFRSFWGVFGWMGVPMHAEVYQALGALTLLAGFGLALHAWRSSARSRGAMPGAAQAPGDGCHRRADAQSADPGMPPGAGDQQGAHDADPAIRNPQQARGMALLVVWLLSTVAGYLWWNAGYVQHQGRYLFPAIVPIGLGVTIGLREVYTRPPRVLLPVVGAMVATLLAFGLWRGDVPWFCVALVAGMGSAVWASPRLEDRWPGSALALTYTAVGALTFLALHVYVIPYLSP